MKEGDIVVAWMMQSDGYSKVRPALILKVMPPFGDLFVCGVSTRVHQMVSGFDELIGPRDPDFPMSGLIAPSIFRLGYAATIPQSRVKGRIGEIAPDRLHRLLNNLADYLRP